MPKRSSTKTTSTARLRKLERLLLDTDVRADLAPVLRAVGFYVKFALHVKVDITKDTGILRWARKHGYILVCHDKHKDAATRYEFYTELYRNGGKVMRIGKHPGQDPLISLGKILVNLKEWREFFSENDGIVTVHKNITLLPSHKLYAEIQAVLDVGLVTGRKVIKRARQRPRAPRRVPSAQERMNIP